MNIDVIALHEQERKDWAELSPQLRDTAVDYLVDKFPPEYMAELDAAIKEHGADWLGKIRTPYPFHFGEGMQIRNLLRDVILDKQLPSGNWDDYYVAAIEDAVAKFFARFA